MKTHKVLLQVFLFGSMLLVSLETLAQFDNGRLKCQGEIPPEFKRGYFESYKDVVESGEIEGGRRARKEFQKFSALIALEMEEMLHGGSVVYGDSISAYCNHLLDFLLKDDVALRSQLRVFTLRSAELNAFSTHQGILFVTTALVASMKNEAQLAYVLSHEIAHFVKKHQFQQFQYTEEIFNADLKNIHYSTDEKLVKSLKYSKKSEYEADDYGMEIFLRAGYDPKYAIESLEILRLMELGSFAMNFNPELYEDEFFKLNVTLYGPDTTEVLERKTESDDHSTHPNTENRIKKLKKKYSDQEAHGPMAFLPISKFQLANKVAVRDLIYNYQLKGNFVQALFLCDYLISQEKTPDADVHISRSYSLYALQNMANRFYKMDSKFFYEFSTFTTGGIRSYLLFFSRLNKAEMNVVAAREIWKTTKLVPLDDFHNALRDKSLGFLKKERVLEKANLSYHLTESVKAECLFCSGAFRDAEYSDLYKMLDQVKSVISDPVIRSEAALLNPGISKMMFFDPVFINLNEKEPVKRRLFNQESYRQLMVSSIEDYSDELGVEVIFRNRNGSGAEVTESFNEFAVMLDFVDVTDLDLDPNLILITEPEIEKIRKKYLTDAVGFSLFWYSRESGKRQSYMLYAFISLDLRDGTLKYSDAKMFQARNRNYLIKAHIYNSLNQIRR